MCSDVNRTAHLAFIQEISMKIPADASVMLNGQDPYAVRVEYQANTARMSVPCKNVAVAYTAIGLGGFQFCNTCGLSNDDCENRITVDTNSFLLRALHGVEKTCQHVCCQRKL